MSKVKQDEERKAMELGKLLSRRGNLSTLGGQRAIVRNGCLSEREVLTAVGPVSVRVPKVRDRSRGGAKSNPAVIPPYVRRSGRIPAALPWLHLNGNR